MSPRIPIDPQRIAAFCRKWRIAKLELFGSVLREDFRADSDVDVLVTYEPGTERSLLEAVEIESELSLLLGRSVDLVPRRAVEESYNWIRKQAILDSAQPIYAAG